MKMVTFLRDGVYYTGEFIAMFKSTYIVKYNGRVMYVNSNSILK